MTPLPRSYMWRSTARVQRKVPVRVTSRTVDHCSSVMSTIGAEPPSPALLIITSMRPRRSTAASTSACTSSSYGDVADLGVGPGAGLLGQAVGGLAEPALVEVGDEDGGALLDGLAGHGGADARAGGRGDHHGLAGEQAVAGDVVGRECGWSLAGSLGRPWARAEAEGSLADDVALDLVGPGVDGVGPGEQEQPLERGELVALARVPDRLVRRAVASGPSTSMASSPRSRCQVAQYSLVIMAAGGARAASSGPDSTRSVFHRMISRPAWAAARRWRMTGSSIRPLAPGHLDDVVELVAEVPSAGRGWTRPARRRGCPWPPSSRCSTPPTTSTPLASAPSKKTSLNSLVPVTWRIGPDLDAVLAQRHEEVGDAPVLGLRVAVGAGQHEHPVGPVGERGPDLLAGDAPVVAVGLGPGRHVGQVGAGVGLAVALRPQLGAGHDRRAGTAACWSASPNAMIVGPTRPSPMWPSRPGPPARAYSSNQITCWCRLRPAAAVLLGPPDAVPAAGTEVLLPGEALVEQGVLVAGTAAAPHAGEVAVELRR